MPQHNLTVPAHLSPLRQDPHGDQTGILGFQNSTDALKYRFNQHFKTSIKPKPKLPRPACPYNQLRAVIGLQNLSLHGHQNHIFLLI